MFFTNKESGDEEYVCHITYIYKTMEQIDALLASHIKYLEEQYKARRFIVSGRRNPRVGGVILANASSLSEMNAIIEQDPFYRHEAAKYEIIEFIPTKYDTSFVDFMDEVISSEDKQKMN
jgi:uncharacterized protein YciI